MTRTVAEKMGIKAASSAYLEGAPKNLLAHIEAPALNLASDLDGRFDYLHLFSTSQHDLADAFSRLKPHLAERGSFWVSWPKGRGMGSDLTLHEVIQIGYARGLVESTCLSIDDTWSALKFTHPKPGKVYNNGHARLVVDEN